ncbi:hypothetical protein NE237_010387 [Protea cynaroides]|uniref:Pectinesterase inhibitor domain-containing protein n=1 Tax=Protea cynaroides TaxID=273540 RepID=A0A9Q0R0M5_9MAGN|nr:hypothetical protein NE237_009335 [Protea cynaroides]KAJ4979607.1 hypothetical protein NE237_010387 [Protea cynaroides]
MASRIFFSICSTALLFIFSISHAYNANSKTVDLDKACNSTLYVDYCKSVFKSNVSLTMHDYSRISVSKSLSAAKKFLQLVESHLKNRQASMTTIQALEDCQLVAGLNVDFLLESSVTINATDTLSLVVIDHVQTQLSATITNHDSCLDSLNATASGQSVKNDLYSSLTDGTKLHSISLAFFVGGWVYTSNTGKVQKEGRKALQASLCQALVNVTVIVNQDGSGNFTTISDAIAAAPNNTNGGNGYFQIHVVEGVYQEYVTIGKNKKYIMIVGDGINRTVITGNRSVGGGSTTFGSATLG